MTGTPAPRPQDGPAEVGLVTLLIAHGSRNPDAARSHEDLVARVGGASAATVRPAYLEITEPSIPDAIDAAVRDGAGEVRLLPYFLHPGNHVAVDLPRIVDEARTRHPATAVVLLEHIGADPGLIELLSARVRPATDGSL